MSRIERRDSGLDTFQPRRGARGARPLTDPDHRSISTRSGSSYDSEHARLESERLRYERERMEKDVRKEEYTRRDMERMRMAQAEQERLLIRGQERTLMGKHDRTRRVQEFDEREQIERIKKQDYLLREQERALIERRDHIRQAQEVDDRGRIEHMREQESALAGGYERMSQATEREWMERMAIMQDAFNRERGDFLRAQDGRTLEQAHRDHEILRREKDLSRREKELVKRELEFTERQEERMKTSRKEKRTNSAKIISEPKQGKLERTQSSSLSTPVAEDPPKSFFSRWPNILASAPAAKVEPVPKSEVAPKVEPAAKMERPEPQPRTTQSALIDLEGYFLQAAEDSQIQKSVIALSDSIDQHVYNHYESRATAPPSDAFLRIVQLDAKDFLLPKTLIDQKSFRLAAIRRTIADRIIRDISIDGDPGTTFLPKEIVSILTMVPAHAAKFRFAASSVFRRIAANLLRVNQGEESQTYAEFKRVQVRKASDRLHKQLSVLANVDSSEAPRKEQLEAILMKAAQIGTLLLLQPTTYRFEWSAQFWMGSSIDDQKKGKLRPGPFVIFPALIRTGDSTGRELRKAQLVCKPECLDEDDLAENTL
ncbi:MAG: hypothetical protein Q9219_002704 [cf. Caloplaca sp. 3 TL-2023]